VSDRELAADAAALLRDQTLGAPQGQSAEPWLAYGCARITPADTPCGLHTPVSAKAKVASADATQGQQREGERAI